MELGVVSDRLDRTVGWEWKRLLIFIRQRA